ncbi:stage III sporulation protein AG [Clostridiisalibacter paucivorans]|uniref:stage III sporulation protein AG n=1 Tax=Clostridiisalibacter paucivorans TaxID=408753 RepID=UPI00047EA7C1|nr:stage III sporulation protein AG [Clostridiisalibacter paucivorans]
MKILDRITSFLSKKENSKVINILVIFFIGLIILISASFFTSDDTTTNILDEKVKVENKMNSKTEDNLIDYYTGRLEQKLAKTLESMKGVGDVEVMVTLDDTVERIPAIDSTKVVETTSEKDAQGGVRERNREDYTEKVVVSNDNSNSLMIIKEVNPKIKGVIVVAEGAQNFEVKEKIYSAVKTVLDISGNKVEVYTKK